VVDCCNIDPADPAALGDAVSKIIEVAKEFERYSAGDLDREEAEAFAASKEPS
jgi:hypothetical protein